MFLLNGLFAYMMLYDIVS